MLVSDLGSSEYHSYYQPYISTLGNVELLSELKEGKTDFSAFIDTIPNSKKDVRYQEGNKTLSAIKNEFLSVRESSISLFSSLNNTELKRIGIASDAEMSVRALGFIICGHQKHHKKILQNRYL